MKKVCIIGGGASALMCACFAKDKDITIFEKTEKVGKKILATGNGRCNLTNLYMNTCSYNRILEKYFNKFNVEQTLAFFKTIGLETYADEEGRVYPVSNTATSVLSVLKNRLDLLKNIKINTENEVNNIEKCKNGYKICFSDGSFGIFDKVVVATGNQTNLKLYERLGIKCKPFLPSLCSLKTERHRNLTGVRVSDVCVKCDDVGFKEKGEILFKDDGISGIVIFNLSAYLSRKNITKTKITIDFLPNLNLREVVKLLEERKKNLEKLKIEEFLTGLFHKQVNLELLKKAGANLACDVNCLNDQIINLIAKNIKSFELEIRGMFDNNQVCCGGVVLEELDNNLQSKKYKDLYFIGETIDVDGVCGGYNLQWAWTSGKIVGESL